MHVPRALCLALSWFSRLPQAPAVSADLLVVLNKSDHEAVLVDPATLKPVARLATGRGPHEVAVSPDGAARLRVELTACTTCSARGSG